MKRKILIAGIACTIFFLAGCMASPEQMESTMNTERPQETDSTNDSSGFTPAPNDIKRGEGISKIFQQGFTPYNIAPLWFIGNTAFYSYSKGMGDDREPYLHFAVADMETETYTDVGKLEVNTASGADVVMGNSYYAWLTNDYTGENSLIRVNAADKSLTVLEKRKTDRPQLIRLDKYSETEFISTVYEQTGGEMQTVVELYDVTTGGKRELMRLRYRNDEQKADSEGVVLEAVCAMDGNIYGIGREKHDGQYRYYFYTYRDGALQSAVEAPVLAAQLDKTIPLDLYKAGDYFVLSDWNFNWMLYRLTGQGVEREPLPLSSNKCRFALNMENFNDSSACRYLFYYPMGEMEQTDTADFYAFDTRTGKHFKIDARFLSTHRYLNSLNVDETGNILLTFETHFCGFDFRYYLLPAQDIPAMLQPVA